MRLRKLNYVALAPSSRLLLICLEASGSSKILPVRLVAAPFRNDSLVSKYPTMQLLLAISYRTQENRFSKTVIKGNSRNIRTQYLSEASGKAL
jgi:hypothetical protein